MHSKSNPQTALLAGSSGLVGSFVLEQLLRAPETWGLITLFTRRILPKQTQVLNQNAERVSVVISDLNFQLMREFDARFAFCALGTTRARAGSKKGLEAVDLDGVISFAKLAKRSGVRHFFCVSSLGADPSSWVHYSQTKGRMERQLRALDFESLHLFRPSLLLGERSQITGEKRSSENLAQKIMTGFFGVFPQSKNLNLWNRYRPIPAQEVASAMVLRAERIAQGEKPSARVEILESDQI